MTSQSSKRIDEGIRSGGEVAAEPPEDGDHRCVAENDQRVRASHRGIIICLRHVLGHGTAYIGGRRTEVGLPAGALAKAGGRRSDIGNWELETGSWKLGTGNWELRDY